MLISISLIVVLVTISTEFLAGDCTSIDEIYVEKYLDRCMDGINHKAKPGPESKLFERCSSWKERSCCTDEIVRDLHLDTLFNFNFSLCGPLSPECLKWHKQDFCFYECTPNVGPWLREQINSIRNEIFAEVPLCESECNSWWDACKDDLTCVKNWGGQLEGEGFDWDTGTNQCPVDSTCQTFREVHGSAKLFCEVLWNHSFEVKPDDEPCMVMWFDGNGTNPNDEVALLKAAELIANSSLEKSLSGILVVLCTILNYVFVNN